MWGTGSGKNWVLLRWVGPCSCSLPGKLFGLRQPSPGVYGLYGRVNGKLQEVLCQGGPSRPAASAPDPADTPPGRPSSTSRQSWFSLLWGHCSPSFGSWCVQDFVCAFQDQSLFSPILWKSCRPIPLSFKAKFPGDSQSLCWIRRLGSLTWGLGPSQQWENFFGVIVLFSSLWVTHLAGVGFDFIVIVLFLLSHGGCFFVFGCGVSFFGGFQCPVNGCSAASCDFGAIIGDNECTSFSSSILNRKLLSCLVFFLTVL